MLNKQVILFLLLSMLSLTVVIAGCAEPLSVDEYDWNILVYMGANNDLERFAVRDINQMEKVGSDLHINVLVLVDWWGVYSESGGSNSTQLYRITQNKSDSKNITSELVADYGELDMTDPKSLVDFVVYAQNKYPAEKTMLNLWSHGTGVYPQSIDAQGIGRDYTTGMGEWDLLTTSEVRFALSEIERKTGEKVDLVNMDACLMQMLEVAYEWKDVTDYLVGSQVLVPGRGNDYHSMLKFLSENPTVEGKELASFLVANFSKKYTSDYSTNYSAIDLGRNFDEFANKFNVLTEELYNINEQELGQIYDIRDNTPDIDSTYIEYIDLLNFFKQVRNNSLINEELEEAIDEFIYAFDSVIIDETSMGIYSSDKEGEAEVPLHGLAVNFPYQQEIWSLYCDDNRYPSLKISKETRWDDFIERIVNYSNENSDIDCKK